MDWNSKRVELDLEFNWIHIAIVSDVPKLRLAIAWYYSIEDK